MIRRDVVLSPDAIDDPAELETWITRSSSTAVAAKYLDRVKAYLATFDLASERGARRDDVRPSLRTIGFERSLTIAFTVEATTVTIQRIFRAGQDWTSAF